MPSSPSGYHARITAAVLTYNGRHLLEPLLTSLAAQTVAPEIHTVVVDNGSTDGTTEWLDECWPAIEVVNVHENRGVTAGLNQCVAAAHGSEFVLLLNNDIRLEPDFVRLLVMTLETEPRAAAAVGKMLSGRDPKRIDGAGDTFSWRGTAYRRGHGTIDVGQFDRTEEVFGACAGAAVYRAEALREVGGFDESFFAYLEDVDWSFRARRLGWKVVYDGSAVATHLGGATLGADLNEFNAYHLWRNGNWVVAKNYTPHELLVNAPALATTQILQLATAARGGLMSAWARATWDSIRGMHSAYASRPDLKRAHVESDLDAVVDPAWTGLVRSWRARLPIGRET